MESTRSARGSGRAMVYAALCLLGLVVLVKLWVYPEWGVRDIRTLDLPPELSISDWELTQGGRLEISPDEQPRPRATRQYQYASEGVIVHVEGRSYEELKVELDHHVVEIMNVDKAGEVRSMGDSGWGLVRTQDGQAMLDVCLDAQGRMTATAEQFAASRSWGDDTLSKVLQRVLGRIPVHDTRCLWIHATIPESGWGRAEAYDLLARVVERWRSAWMAGFE